MKKHTRNFLFSSTLPFVFLVAACSVGASTAGAADMRALAEEILDLSGVRGGLVVLAGCDDGRLAAAFGAKKGFLVQCLVTGNADIEKAREDVRHAGLYGKVSIVRWGGGELPYVDNLVNLLVVEKPDAVSKSEILRVLAPNGVACLKAKGQWTRIVKPRSSEIDEWTHALHGPNNNAVSNDKVVGPPEHLQWVAGPRWARSHEHLASVSVVVSSGGRIFYIVDEGPTAAIALPSRWRLVARDAFNGALLWKRPMGPWEWRLRGFRTGPPDLQRRLVAVGNRVYVTLGYGEPVVALDAATGKTLKTYDGTEGASEIVCSDGMLFVVTGDPKTELAFVEAERRGEKLPTCNKNIVALDANTGRILWRKKDADTTEVMPTTLGTDGKRVFFQNPKAVIALDVKTGKVLWRAERHVPLRRPSWSAPTLVVWKGIVYSADRPLPRKPKKERTPLDHLAWEISTRGGNAPGGELIAFSADSGKELWRCKCREGYNSPVDVLIAGGLLWTGNLVRHSDPGITQGRDPKTGEIKKRRPRDQTFYRIGMYHHRCYRNKATNRFLITGRAGVEFIDLETGKAVPDHWVRGACQYGIIPCNGLLYAPPHSCACYIEAKLSGFNALAPARKASARPPAQRLIRGPAYGEGPAATTRSESHDDWPTYRHDAARSGFTPSVVPPKLTQAWCVKLGENLSAPVIADGKVFVADIETHTLHALDATNGQKAWSFAAGGRIDSPPTIRKGLVVFGCADGRVYCLRAADGRLVWSFLAAPEDRRLVAYDQVESVWPVHGNVLVADDVVWFAAGRSSFLDGGLVLYRLDLQTGKELSSTLISGRDPKTGLERQAGIHGFEMPGALPDVLSSDGESVFMRQLRFAKNGSVQKNGAVHLFGSAGFLDGSWWHRTYWIFGKKFLSGWGGWPIVGNEVPAGRILCVDETDVYGFGRNQYNRGGAHLGFGGIHYRLFCASRELKKVQVRRRPRQKPQTRTRVRYHWTRSTPILVRAMVLTPDDLFIAGPHDVGRMNEEAVAALEGKRGGTLMVVAKKDGATLASYKLDSPPVWDGMAAARGRIYLATLDGFVLCFSAAD